MKKYLTNFYRSFILLLIMLPFQNCIEMNGFQAANSNSQPSTEIEGDVGNDNNGNESGESKPGGNEQGGEPVAVFFAAGHMRSSMYSCDGGETWKGYKTLNEAIRCFDTATGDYDCNHDQGSVMGVSYGPAGFMITSGWGQPGKVELTSDGKSFNTVHEGATWAGLAYGNGLFILNSRKPHVSVDDGISWERGGDASFTPYNARKISFIDQGSGFFISQAQSGDVRDMLISRDNGESWVRPDNFPTECGNGGIAYNGSSTILVSTSVALCISQDQGYTWQALSGDVPSGDLIRADGEFRIYERGYVNRSTDGLTWTREPLALSGVGNTNLSLGIVKFHEGNNRYIAIYQGWRRWYENTKYYYSDDGIDWTLVDKESGAAPMFPHPVRAIEVGYMQTCD